jgi:hypothetical protein
VLVERANMRKERIDRPKKNSESRVWWNSPYHHHDDSEAGVRPPSRRKWHPAMNSGTTRAYHNCARPFGT